MIVKLDIKQNKIGYGKKEVKCQPKDLRILAYLSKQSGSVSRKRLLRKFWEQDTRTSKKLLNSAIWRLKKILYELTGNEELIVFNSLELDYRVAFDVKITDEKGCFFKFLNYLKKLKFRDNKMRDYRALLFFSITVLIITIISLYSHVIRTVEQDTSRSVVNIYQHDDLTDELYISMPQHTQDQLGVLLLNIIQDEYPHLIPVTNDSLPIAISYTSERSSIGLTVSHHLGYSIAKNDKEYRVHITFEDPNDKEMLYTLYLHHKVTGGLNFQTLETGLRKKLLFVM